METNSVWHYIRESAVAGVIASGVRDSPQSGYYALSGGGSFETRYFRQIFAFLLQRLEMTDLWLCSTASEAALLVLRKHCGLGIGRGDSQLPMGGKGRDSRQRKGD